ncbi:hypothetical protein BGZ94_001369 [Podila epigama]|nr:hypothetical protein BGZ94_001369 [Podila epigama]
MTRFATVSNISNNPPLFRPSTDTTATMGKPLVPICFAANHEYIYAAAQAIRYNAENKEEGEKFLALIRSDRNPVSIPASNWTVVSTLSPFTESLWKGSCFLDKAGSFSLHDERSGSIKRIVYDSTTSTWTTNSTLKVQQETWQDRMVIIWPGDVIGGVNATSETLIQYTNAEMVANPGIKFAQLPRDETEVKNFSYATLGPWGKTVVHMRYGQGRLFAILQDNKDSKRTLMHFPVSPPNIASGLPGSATTVPWETRCTDSPYGTASSSAVANGKFYYLCSTPPGDGVNTTTTATLNNNRDQYTLYIHDIKTNTTKVGFTTSDGYVPVDSLTLSYSASNETEPRYAIVSTGSYTRVIDLQAANEHWVLLKDKFLVSENIKNPDPPYEDPCYESCYFGRQITKLIIGLSVTAAVLIFICCFFCYRQKQRSKAKKRAIVNVQNESQA